MVGFKTESYVWRNQHRMLGKEARVPIMYAAKYTLFCCGIHELRSQVDLSWLHLSSILIRGPIQKAEKKVVHRLSIVWFLVINKSNCKTCVLRRQRQLG